MLAEAVFPPTFIEQNAPSLCPTKQHYFQDTGRSLTTVPCTRHDRMQALLRHFGATSYGQFSRGFLGPSAVMCPQQLSPHEWRTSKNGPVWGWSTSSVIPKAKNWLLGMTSGTRMWGTGWKKIQHYICIRNKRIVQASRVFVENHDGSEQPPRLLHLNSRE